MKRIFKLTDIDQSNLVENEIISKTYKNHMLYISIHDMTSNAVIVDDRLSIIANVENGTWLLLNCIDEIFIENKPNYNVRLLETINGTIARKMGSQLHFEYNPSKYIDRLIYTCDSLTTKHILTNCFASHFGFNLSCYTSISSMHNIELHLPLSKIDLLSIDNLSTI